MQFMYPFCIVHNQSVLHYCIQTGIYTHEHTQIDTEHRSLSVMVASTNDNDDINDIAKNGMHKLQNWVKT